MRVAQINMCSNGSTGKIMFMIAKTAREDEMQVLTCSAADRIKGKSSQVKEIQDHFIWGSPLEREFHVYAGIILGRNGMFSRIGTRALIKRLKLFQPDIVHLHNLHSFCINLPLLFRYLRKNNISVVWTLHDCWAFTGHCPYFTMVKCDKWKTGCGKCPQLDCYPKTWIDTTRMMFKQKRKWFCGIKGMTIVTPSRWLADLARQSFLNQYPIKVINNGIDLSVFKPTESNFRQKYCISTDKSVLLGVAFGWGKRKGLDVFIELFKRLDREKYQIVLVGTDDKIDDQLPGGIISIHRTNDQKELAQIYSAADLFVNPTREEVLGMVNIESLACGTPVLTFRTGGSPEILDEYSGSVVPCDDIDALEKEIVRICETKPFKREDCVKRAAHFDMYKKFKEYISLYEDCAHSSRLLF